MDNDTFIAYFICVLKGQFKDKFLKKVDFDKDCISSVEALECCSKEYYDLAEKINTNEGIVLLKPKKQEDFTHEFALFIQDKIGKLGTFITEEL